MVSVSTQQSQPQTLAGLRVAIAGRLASMSKRDAERIIRERGGRVADRWETADWIVVGDEAAAKSLCDEPWEANDASLASTGELPQSKTVRESEFWSRLGMLDADLSVARLYTPAILAGLVRVPVSAIRVWHRQGALRATREVRRLAYFDFPEVSVAQKLATLSRAGCSPTTIQRKLVELKRLLPNIERPLASPDVVVEGRGLYLRRGDNLAEPSGQWLIDFDAPADGPVTDDRASQDRAVAVPFNAGDALRRFDVSHTPSPGPNAADELRALAGELEESGNLNHAIEAYRAILVSGQATAEDQFALAELLYRAGDFSAARERYYVAIELDEDFAEARANLGCVLAEMGESELAEAAFRGALACHPHYADAHYHLARLLDGIGQSEDAAPHWREFMRLAPASPWADEALERTGGH